MKKIILITVAAFSLSALAHTIEGTLILKGSLKTKLVINSVKTTCRVKVEKVKNLLLEDSFGNPAYNVRIDVALDGSDLERNLTVKHSKEIWFNNLFKTANGTEVRDLEYAAADGSRLLIDREGRIESVSFSSPYKTITCAF